MPLPSIPNAARKRSAVIGVLGVLAGLLAGGAGGYFLGRHQAEVAAAKSGVPGAPVPAAAAGVRTSPLIGSAAKGSRGRSSMIVDDPARALRDLISITDVEARNEALRELLSSVPPDQMPGVLERFAGFLEDQEFEDELGGLITAMSTFEVIASHIASTAPREIIAALVKSENDKIGDLCPLLIRQWAARDLSAALAYYESDLRSHENDGLRRQGAEGLAREFVKRDPAGAFDWIARLPEGARDGAAHAGFQTLSHRDSDAALRLVVERTDLSGREGIAADLAAGWAKTEPEKALQWALGLPPEISANAVKRSMESLAARDFGAALRETAALSPELQAAVLPAVASGADASSAPALAAMLEQQPEGAERSSASRTLMNRWATTSPEEASRWLATQPAGAARDQAVIGFADSVFDGDPEAALEWVSTIGDSNVRQQRLTQHLERWNVKDAAAARAWAQSAERLTPAERSQFGARLNP